VSEQFPDYADICRRCCRCATFKGNDPDNLGTETLDGAYLCPVCTTVVMGEEPKDWPLEWRKANLEVERLKLEVQRLEAENAGLREAVMNAVTEDARR
jgi:hypothetical protein